MELILTKDDISTLKTSLGVYKIFCDNLIIEHRQYLTNSYLSHLVDEVFNIEKILLLIEKGEKKK